MTYTVISSFQLPQSWPTAYGSSGTLGIFATQNFVADDGKQYLVGAGDSLTAQFVTKADISVSGGVATVAPFSLPKTDLATPQNTARYTARVFDANGSPRDDWPFVGFHLKSVLGDSISYLYWYNNNQIPITPAPDGAPTIPQMDVAIAAAVNAPATVTQLGTVKVDTVPVDPSTPRAVGTNSLLVSAATATNRGTVTTTTSTSSGRAASADDPQLLSALGAAEIALSSRLTYGVATQGVFVSDPFNDTAGTLLDAHVGTLGATWVKHPISSTAAAIINSAGRVRPSVAVVGTDPIYLASGLPLTNEYDVEVDVFIVTNAGVAFTGIVGRFDGATKTGYAALVLQSTQVLHIYRLNDDAGGTSLTDLGSFSAILAPQVSVSAASNANPASLTVTSHGLVTGQKVSISGGIGNWTAINGDWTATVTGVNTFTIPVDSTTFGALAGTVKATPSYKLKLALRATGVSAYFDAAVYSAARITSNDVVITDGGYAGVWLGNQTNDTAGYQLDNFTVTAQPQTPVTPSTQTYPVTDPAIYFSPYVWVSGAGYRQATNPGAYLLTVFSGRNVSATFNLSSLTGGSVPVASYPRVKWRIDGGPWRASRVASSVTLAKGLPAGGAHLLELAVQSVDLHYDQWTTPVMAVRVSGITIDADGLLYAPPVRPTMNLIRGDSITGGDVVVSNNSATGSSNDSTLSWAHVVAERMRGEYAQLGYGGLGWAHNNVTNIPPFYTIGNDTNSSYNKLWAGQPLSLTPLQPANVLICLGDNDTGDVTATVTAALTAQRTQTPSAKVFVILPFDGAHASQITAGFNAYQVSPDSNAILVDAGVTGLYPTNDGVHPTAAGHVIIADGVWAQIKSQVAH